MLIDKTVPFTYIFKKIKVDLLFILIIGVVINFLSTLFSPVLPEMPLNVPTFLGTAISVLLSFKMSQSYDRWWEARKVWGAIVNDSRSFVVQLQSFIASGNQAAIKRMGFRQVAWSYALGRSLRGQNPMDNLARYLNEDDLKSISKHNNKPLALIQLNSMDLKTLRDGNVIDAFSYIQLDNTLVRLCDSMGKAERINSTVFPVTYRLFLHYAIYLFVITLSIALRNVDPLFEIPLLALISSIFFLLEKTAYHLQDPFRDRPSDVPVTAIATTIEINIKQLLNEEDVPQQAPVETFYVL